MENKYELLVNSYNTVYKVKQQIEKSLNINVLQQRLIYLGYPMVDEAILEQYNIKNNSVILLTMCMM
jgi:hypothetical protein